MKNLTSEEVRFIDNYLKNSGVNFLDIRLEMIDHIASAIEQELEQQADLTFYTAFKSYMIRNKKSLLKNASRQRWSVDLKVINKIRKELFRNPALITGIGSTAIFVNLDLAQVVGKLWFSVLFTIIVITAYFVPVILYSRLKISFLSRLSFYAYLVNYLFYLLLNHMEPPVSWLGICFGLLVWLNIGVLTSAFRMSAYYNKQFSQYEEAK